MTTQQTSFDGYLSLSATALRERYLRVMAHLSNLHMELAMVRGQERRTKVMAWMDVVRQGGSQRDADKQADYAALEMTLEVWNVTADIEAATCEKDVLLMMMDVKNMRDGGEEK